MWCDLRDAEKLEMFDAEAQMFHTDFDDQVVRNVAVCEQTSVADVQVESQSNEAGNQ